MLIMDAILPIELQAEAFSFSRPISAYEYFDTKISERNFCDPIESNISDEIMARLSSFSYLDENWDSNGAVQLDDATIENCFFLLQKLPKKYLQNISRDDISLTPYGTIVLDWTDKNKMLSLEIGDDSIGYFAKLANNETSIAESVKLEKNKVPNELVDIFYKFHS